MNIACLPCAHFQSGQTRVPYHTSLPLQRERRLDNASSLCAVLCGQTCSAVRAGSTETAPCMQSDGQERREGRGLHLRLRGALTRIQSVCTWSGIGSAGGYWSEVNGYSGGAPPARWAGGTGGLPGQLGGPCVCGHWGGHRGSTTDRSVSHPLVTDSRPSKWT